MCEARSSAGIDLAVAGAAALILSSSWQRPNSCRRLRALGASEEREGPGLRHVDPTLDRG